MDYRELFENASDLIYTTDLQHRITAFNKAGEELTGYTSDELVGKRIDRIVPSEYLTLFDQIRDRLLAGKPSAMFEVELLTRNGRKFPVEASTRLIYEGRHPAGMQGIVRDVTEHRRLQEQLWFSQKMEAVGQLAGGIAHDFNNLLTIVLGYTNLASDALRPNNPIYRHIEGIRKSAQRASSLTRQLLAFSRRQVLQPRILNLNSVIVDLDKLLMRLIGEDIELTTSLDPNVGFVKADPGQIEQVLMNLVINARDAMPNGGRITIRTSNSELTEEDARRYHYVQPGPYVLTEVTDTGCGMDEGTLSRIFEPFFTTKQAGKGTGLGLATVYGIVKQSGGYIWASSEPGKGAAVRVYLPLTTETPLAEDSRVEKDRPAVGAEVVLLVEDEEELRKLLRDTLKKAGYSVLEASNGSEALQLSDKHPGPIHAVVTDMVMPKVGGRSLAQQLSISRPNTLVLYMSGYMNDATVRRDGLESGTHFLQKPFEPALLTMKIRDLLDRKAPR